MGNDLHQQHTQGKTHGIEKKPGRTGRMKISSIRLGESRVEFPPTTPGTLTTPGNRPPLRRSDRRWPPASTLLQGRHRRSRLVWAGKYLWTDPAGLPPPRGQGPANPCGGNFAWHSPGARSPRTVRRNPHTGPTALSQARTGRCGRSLGIRGALTLCGKIHPRRGRESRRRATHRDRDQGRPLRGPGLARPPSRSECRQWPGGERGQRRLGTVVRRIRHGPGRTDHWSLIRRPIGPGRRGQVGRRGRVIRPITGSARIPAGIAARAAASPTATTRIAAVKTTASLAADGNHQGSHEQDQALHGTTPFP